MMGLVGISWGDKSGTISRKTGGGGRENCAFDLANSAERAGLGTGGEIKASWAMKRGERRGREVGDGRNEPPRHRDTQSEPVMCVMTPGGEVVDPNFAGDQCGSVFSAAKCLPRSSKATRMVLRAA